MKRSDTILVTVGYLALAAAFVIFIISLSCTPTTPDGGDNGERTVGTGLTDDPVTTRRCEAEPDRPAVRCLYHNTKWFVEVQPGSGDFLMYKPYYNGRILVGAWWEEIADTSVVEGPKIIVNPPGDPDDWPQKTATKPKKGK